VGIIYFGVSINKGIARHVRLRNFQINKLLLPHLLCVGGIISLPRFSKELEKQLIKEQLTSRRHPYNVRESIFVGLGFPFPIVWVPRYKLSLCHTPIKPDLVGFPGIYVFACELLDRVIRMFGNYMIRATKNQSDSDSDIKCAAIHFHVNSHNSQVLVLN